MKEPFRHLSALRHTLPKPIVRVAELLCETFPWIDPENPDDFESGARQGDDWVGFRLHPAGRAARNGIVCLVDIAGEQGRGKMSCPAPAFLEWFDPHSEADTIGVVSLLVGTILKDPPQAFTDRTFEVVVLPPWGNDAVVLSPSRGTQRPFRSTYGIFFPDSPDWTPREGARPDGREHTDPVPGIPDTVVDALEWHADARKWTGPRRKKG